MDRTVDRSVELRATDPSGVIPAALASLNIVLGIWLLASPYLIQFTVWTSARINDDIMGPLIIGMAITRLAMWSQRYWWLSLGNVIFGLWVAISPFALGYFHSLPATLDNVVVGLLVALFSAAGLLRHR